MPQFDLANFLPQMVWLVVAFAILYFVIVRTTLPRLGRTIDQRSAQIHGDLGEARRAKDEADTLRESIRAEAQRNREAAMERIAEAKAQAARTSEQRLHEADAETEAHVEAAQERIAQAKREAHGSLRAVAIESAQALVAKLTGHDVSDAEAGAAVDRAMAN